MEVVQCHFRRNSADPEVKAATEKQSLAILLVVNNGDDDDNDDDDDDDDDDDKGKGSHTNYITKMPAESTI